ncbi:hypothetical protein AB837_00458 [bacterium AB1]|nr:hypothetical protein AB837_00458 [bacterium AB1]
MLVQKDVLLSHFKKVKELITVDNCVLKLGISAVENEINSLYEQQSLFSDDENKQKLESHIESLPLFEKQSLKQVVLNYDQTFQKLTDRSLEIINQLLNMNLINENFETKLFYMFQILDNGNETLKTMKQDFTKKIDKQ